MADTMNSPEADIAAELLFNKAHVMSKAQISNTVQSAIDLATLKLWEGILPSFRRLSDVTVTAMTDVGQHDKAREISSYMNIINSALKTARDAADGK